MKTEYPPWTLHWPADLADGQGMRQVVDALIERLSIGTEGQVPVVVVGTGAEGVGASQRRGVGSGAELAFEPLGQRVGRRENFYHFGRQRRGKFFRMAIVEGAGLLWGSGDVLIDVALPQGVEE